jgi:hypothetical protein
MGPEHKRIEDHPAKSNITSGKGGKTAKPPKFAPQASKAQDQQAPKPAKKTFTLGGKKRAAKKGDTWDSLSSFTYGNSGFSKQIKAANPQITSLDEGQIVQLPQIEVPFTDFPAHKFEIEVYRDILAHNAKPEDLEAYYLTFSEANREKLRDTFHWAYFKSTAGMNETEIVDAQTQYLQAQAAEKGQTSGQYIKTITQTQGYGSSLVGKEDPYGNGIGQVLLDAWVEREIPKAPKEVQTEIARAKAKGAGNFIYDFEGTQKARALAYTHDDFNLYLGDEWLTMALEKPASVYGNIMHEITGHNDYGKPLGDDLMEKVVEQMPDSEQAVAKSSGNPISSAYGYPETELFAELREHQFAHNQTRKQNDLPFEEAPMAGDVYKNLVKIQQLYEPRIAAAMVKTIWLKVKHDKIITPATKDKFRNDVETVFGMKLN